MLFSADSTHGACLWTMSEHKCINEWELSWTAKEPGSAVVAASWFSGAIEYYRKALDTPTQLAYEERFEKRRAAGPDFADLQLNSSLRLPALVYVTQAGEVVAIFQDGGELVAFSGSLGHSAPIVEADVAGTNEGGIHIAVTDCESPAVVVYDVVLDTLSKTVGFARARSRLALAFSEFELGAACRLPTTVPRVTHVRLVPNSNGQRMVTVIQAVPDCVLGGDTVMGDSGAGSGGDGGPHPCDSLICSWSFQSRPFDANINLDSEADPNRPVEVWILEAAVSCRDGVVASGPELQGLVSGRSDEIVFPPAAVVPGADDGSSAAPPFLDRVVSVALCRTGDWMVASTADGSVYSLST